MKYQFGILMFLTFFEKSKILPYRAGKKWLKQECPSFIIYGNDSQDLNCEHIIPRSFVKFNEKEKLTVNDLHLLYLSNAKINSHRNNFSFGIINDNLPSTVFITEIGEKTEFPSHCKKNKKLRLFEPPQESKGVIARTVAYYTWNYNVDVGNQVLHYKLLKKWNRENPVNQQEIEKNNKILKVQGNKNLFIDYPYLTSFLFSRPILLLRKWKQKHLDS